RDNFPPLRLIEQDRFDRKQKIPIESVYAYIEAKHTLCLEGKGEQSLWKAWQQVQRVKSIPRDPFPWTMQDPYLAVAGTVQPPTHWPSTRNQLVGAIMARQVRLKPRSQVLDDPRVVRDALAKSTVPRGIHPDLIVAGLDVVCLPVIDLAYETPFFIEE